MYKRSSLVGVFESDKEKRFITLSTALRPLRRRGLEVRPQRSVRLQRAPHLRPGTNVIKLFSSVINGFRNQLERLSLASFFINVYG
jgi:hypothetical protein